MSFDAHTKDSDCIVGADGHCRLCDAYHGDQCIDCGQRAFHAPSCRMVEQPLSACDERDPLKRG